MSMYNKYMENLHHGMSDSRAFDEAMDRQMEEDMDRRASEASYAEYIEDMIQKEIKSQGEIEQRELL